MLFGSSFWVFFQIDFQWMDNPIIIAGYNISWDDNVGGENVERGIEIINTTLYFQFKDNVVRLNVYSDTGPQYRAGARKPSSVQVPAHGTVISLINVSNSLIKNNFLVNACSFPTEDSNAYGDGFNTGIRFQGENISIVDNIFSSGLFEGTGTNIKITNNTISGFAEISGSDYTFQNNNISYDGFGFGLDELHNANISYNIFNDPYRGLKLGSSNNLNLFHNKFTNLELYNTTNTVIYHNIIKDSSEYGIELHSSINNTIHQNDFINNNLDKVSNSSSKALDSEKNNFTHNYWSDLVVIDENKDGIIDTKYEIDNTNYDPYPRTEPIHSLLEIGLLIQ